MFAEIEVAGSTKESPLCWATMVQLPRERRVRIAPFTLHTFSVELEKLTGRPEEEIALSPKLPDLSGSVFGGENVISFDARIEN